MNTLKYALKKEWYNVILLLLPFLAIPFVWEYLPDRIPTHWNLQGEVDDYSSKTFGLLVIPVLNVAVYLMLLYLPKIDPKQHITIGQKPIPVMRTLTVGLLLAIHAWMIALGIGLNIPSTHAAFLLLALFFMVTGNYLRTIQPNYFIGIRVPWTLEDEDNWRRTHRLGAWIWVAGGLLLLILYPFVAANTYTILFFIIVGIMALAPIAYSFYLYKSADL